ncbi:MAG: hypothetical protein KC933_17955 [Myxococcales bacterium]|nr:hypothetical protein [Myxococcales bacterium]
MRRAALRRCGPVGALILWAFLAAGCATEVIELAPGTTDASADSGLPTDTGVPADSGVLEDTGVPEDTGVADTGAADAGFPDAEPEDTGPADTGPADTGVACVCRMLSCQSTQECTILVDRLSECTQRMCTGASARCQTAQECGIEAGWACTTGTDSTTPCP